VQVLYCHQHELWQDSYPHEHTCYVSPSSFITSALLLDIRYEDEVRKHHTAMHMIIASATSMNIPAVCHPLHS
jgi:hypothetical protein